MEISLGSFLLVIKHQLINQPYHQLHTTLSSETLQEMQIQKSK